MAGVRGPVAGIPVLVNGECEVLKEQCRRSNGGLYYRSYQEFDLSLSLLMSNPELRRQLATAGRRFAQETYDWGIIEKKYRALLSAMTGRHTANHRIHSASDRSTR